MASHAFEAAAIKNVFFAPKKREIKGLRISTCLKKQTPFGLYKECCSVSVFGESLKKDRS